MYVILAYVITVTYFGQAKTYAGQVKIMDHFMAVHTGHK